MWVHAVKDYCNALALASNGTQRVSLDDPAAPLVLAKLGAAPVQEATSRSASDGASDRYERQPECMPLF